jgi:hypothetical protein
LASGRQLPIPQAPKLDRYGLHDHDCECARCVLGFRPSIAQRDLARRNWERAERAKAEAAKAAAQPKPTAKADARAAAFAREEKRTDEYIASVNRPPERPATPAELAELRAAYPRLRPRRKGTT